MVEIKIIPYTDTWASRWNDFVAGSKNGTFLFHRQYLEYHAARFVDNSLMVVNDNNIIALLPANRLENSLMSHGGLTYGGWVVDHKMTVEKMLEIFEAMYAYARSQGIEKIIYKAMPKVFHRDFADEDLYALFRAQARRIRVDAGAALSIHQEMAWSKGKKQSLAKAEKAGIRVEISDKYIDFYHILEDVLAHHGARPTHSLAELELLASRFPTQIQLLTALQNDEIIAGIVLYRCGQTLHTQYMASGEKGRALGGLEAIVRHIITTAAPGEKILNFGISTENHGMVLNSGLMAQKEMFGARCVVHETYEIIV
jgi:Acetyltransferase (GNAT) domain